jgi:tetratricopeptide (TPR) repeat protein
MDPSIELVENYVRALGQLGDREELEQVLIKQVRVCDTPRDLRMLANLAIESDREDLAVEAYRRLLQKVPADAESHKVIGRHAFFQGSRTVAKVHLRQSLVSEPNDAEVLFFLGEIARAEKDPGGSTYHKRALAALKQGRLESREERILEAKLLNRLGETERSLELFRTLIRKYPGDSFLRGDFVSVLIENQQYREAEALLDLRQNDG